MDEERGNLKSLKWSADGQFMTVTTKKYVIHLMISGKVKTFLSKLPALFGLSNQSVAYLSSINQISITDVCYPEKTIKKSLEMEPSVIGLSENILAFGINNKVKFFMIDEASNFKDVFQKVHFFFIINSGLYLYRQNYFFKCTLCSGSFD